MKKILQFSIAGVAWLAVMAAPLAKAWTYSDGDVLLIFRETGAYDVEFDIGNISQFLGHSAPYSTQVTGWDPNLVVNTFGSIGGASVIVAATTAEYAGSPSAWLSSSYAVSSVSDVSHTDYAGQLYDNIDGIGNAPVEDGETAAEANAYVIQETGDTAKGESSLASYYYIVTGGGVSGNYITEFGGHVPFVVEGIAPATLGFWQIDPTSTSPQPSATYVGTFDIDANNNLYFYVGSLEPKITAVTHSGATDTVSFTTLANGSYSLIYSTDLTLPISQWTTVTDSDENPYVVTGNNSTQSISFTSPGDSADYFAVVRSP
jgi:hypothetical protein